MDSDQTPLALQELAVERLMSRELLTVSPHDSVLMAWELMRRSRYHHLPVVTDDGRLLGLIDAAAVLAHWRPDGPDANSGPVSDLLHGRWRDTVAPQTLVREAATIMTRRHLDAIAVTSEDGHLLGLLTMRDLVAALAGDKPAESAETTSTPALYRIEPILPAATHRHGGLAPG